MDNRRGFLKMMAMAAVATALPKMSPEKLYLPLVTSNADMGIGVGEVERMRITSSGHIMIHSSGNVGISNTTPNAKLNIV